MMSLCMSRDSGLGAAHKPWAGMVELREVGCLWGLWGGERGHSPEHGSPRALGNHSAARGFPTPQCLSLFPRIYPCLFRTPRAAAKAEPGVRQLSMKPSLELFLPPLNSDLEPGPSACPAQEAAQNHLENPCLCGSC